MKKALFVVIPMAMMFALACKTQPANNQNASQNTNSSVVQSSKAPNAITLRYDIIKKSGGEEVEIIETCFDCVAGVPAVTVLPFDPKSTLNLGVRFVNFVAADEVSVKIQDFKAITTPPITLPSGPLPSFPSENPFDPDTSVTILDPIKFSFSGFYQSISVPPHKVGTFKYAVAVEWKVGGKLRKCIMDPRVVLSDGSHLF